MGRSLCYQLSSSVEFCELNLRIVNLAGDVVLYKAVFADEMVTIGKVEFASYDKRAIWLLRQILKGVAI